MSIIDIQLSSCGSQYPIGGIEEGVGRAIILRPEPLCFHYSPKSLHDIQMWRIRRNPERSCMKIKINARRISYLKKFPDTGMQGIEN
jgi:hypothetical protein